MNWHCSSRDLDFDPTGCALGMVMVKKGRKLLSHQPATSAFFEFKRKCQSQPTYQSVRKTYALNHNADDRRYKQYRSHLPTVKPAYFFYNLNLTTSYAK